MPEIAQARAAPVASSDGRRRLRNYLLDARFQLKFTGYIVAITLVIAGGLGAFLFTTSRALMREAQLAVEARSRAAETSKELSNATLSNELLQRFNDPAFEQQLREKSATIDAQYEAEKNAILGQRLELEQKQRVIWLTVVGSLVAFVVFVALATIVATHRIVGPVFRIKRLASELSAGRLAEQVRGLREGDELKDVFEALTNMATSLRQRQMDDLRDLGAALDLAKAEGRAPLAIGLQALYARMKSRVEG